MGTKGFGRSSAPEPPTPSESSRARDAAGERLERMRATNAPEYSIWLRITDVGEDAEDEASPDFPWLPVGSISVPRNADIAKAIYNEDVFTSLMSGARKLFPQLKRYGPDAVEVGYMLKDSADDDDVSNVKTAVRPTENIFAKLRGGLGSIFNKGK
jgi:hypothetical protein